jgi:hypothetical protein
MKNLDTLYDAAQRTIELHNAMYGDHDCTEQCNPALAEYNRAITTA